MGSITKSPHDSAQSFRDPNFAATLSILPGLGQIYVGQKRKGTLFLAVGLINLLLLAVLLFQQSIIFSLHQCATTYHFKANPSLEESLSMLRVGTMPANILLSMIFAFISLAMRDARNAATEVSLKDLYPSNALGLEEAASGSYVLHVVLIIAGFILAFFFVSPPPESKQFTVIEMVDTQLTTTQKKQVTKLNSAHNTQAHGPKSHEAPAQEQQKAASNPTVKPHTNAQPVKQKVSEPAEPKKAMPPPVMTKPVQSVVNRPVPQPIAPQALNAVHTPTPPKLASTQNVSNNTPTPLPTHTKVTNAPPMPLPNLAMATSQSTPGPLPSRFQPNAVATPNPASGSGAPRKSINEGGAPAAPQASQVNLGPTGSGAEKTPTPTGEYQKTVHGDSNGAPSPTHANFSGGPTHSQPIAFGPAVLDNGRGHEAKKGANDSDGPPGNSEPGTSVIDWGPYMNDLQRRIKTHWFPPKNLESVKVVVVFKVSKNGELSNLHLQRSSGSAEADKRALAAVEDAAPFRSLPPGADPVVDIQFTFDYNVFAGSSHRY